MSINLAAEATFLSPVTGKPLAPRVPGGAPLNLSGDRDPRQHLADWLTARDNPYFARNIVNRYWGALLGCGLVDPVDDMRLTNPPSHPALLDELSRDFVKSGFDLRHLLRTICNSRTYQLASEIAPKRDADRTFFTHRGPRRLPAEVLLDAINQACETSEDFTGMPRGMRALALPDPAVASTFLDTFGRPKRTTNCECERPTGTNLAQALSLVNGEKLHLKVTSAKGRVARLLAAKKTEPEIVEELYLATLSRRPSAGERQKVLDLLKLAPSQREGLEDLLWTLVNLGEFNCNH
jgi:hypothetical protein